MPFRIKKSEPLGKALRRIGRECVGKARAQLRKRHRPAAIHEARKEIKKLRAIFQLVHGEFAPEIYRKGMKALRQTACRLSATRDARVTLKAFERLAGIRSEQFLRTGVELKKYARQTERKFQMNASADAARKRLRKVRCAVDDLKIEAAGWTVIQAGLKQSFTQGREAYERVRRNPQPESFHEWRKRIKLLWYQLCLLNSAWGKPTQRMVDDLESLGEQLGEEHDLELLRKFMAERVRGHRREAVELRRLLAERQEEIRKSAMQLGRRFYAAKPGLICSKLHAEWELWRSDGD